MSSQTASRFSEVFYASVIEGLKKVLGETGAQVILFYLGLDQDTGNLQEFHGKLYSILGAGAVVVEEQIVKELFQRLDLPYDEVNIIDFERYFESATAQPQPSGFHLLQQQAASDD